MKHARVAEKARIVAETIRRAGNYRWVGLYDVADHHITAVAWTGLNAPENPRFADTAGINGRAVHNRRTVIVSDVLLDPDYLTTFSSTRSEMVVPICDLSSRVFGTIDVESDRVNAFTLRDIEFVETWARAAAPLWFLP